MKKSLIFAFIISIVYCANIFAQDMFMPPKPIDNKVMESMIGSWEGESDMMGMKMKDNVKIYWGLSKHFMIMEVTSTSPDGKGMNYNGIAIYGLDKDGNIKAWWFDDWGAEGIMNGTGKFDGNKMNVVSKNEMYSDDRTTEVNGDEMTMNAISTWKENGAEKKMEQKTIYKRKN